MDSDSKTTYHQQVSFCGKESCRKCREGIGHGPYWYAYTITNGRTTRKYIGKQLPPEIQAALTSNPSTAPTSPTNQADPDDVLLRLFTLGQFRLERLVNQQWQTVTDLAQHTNARTLLALLISDPTRTVKRDQVMQTLWPVSDLKTAESNLDKTLLDLRKILGHPREGYPHGMLLRSEGDWLILAPQHNIWVDADAFSTLVAHATLSPQPEPGDDQIPNAQAPDPTTHTQQMHLLLEAMPLYKGDFLPQEQHIPPVSERRQELARAWITLRLKLADLYLAIDDMTSAMAILNRFLAEDPTSEGAVQRLMIVLARSNRRIEALRVYHRLVDVLQHEYKLLPSQETQALYEAVRQGLETLPSLPSAPSLRLIPVAAQSVEDIPTASIGRSRQSPLVGRKRELETLQTLLLELESGPQESSQLSLPLDTQRRPQCVVLMGEPGIGKTRLAAEISRVAQQRGWTSVLSRAYQQESRVPYRLWIEALRGTLASSVETELPPTLATLQPLTSLLPELSETLPQTGSAPLPQFKVDPEQEQLRLREAARDLLILTSTNTPLLITLDDIQWADASSCELLGYLARQLHGYPVLLVATCREKELPTHPRHPLHDLMAHMKREHSLITLPLEPLSTEQIATLVRGVSQPSAEMVQYIQHHAAGNPLFAEELARTAPPSLPENISAVFKNRLDRLSNPCQQLLDKAAVLGDSFKLSFISAMAAAPTGTTDPVGDSLANEDTVLDLLEEGLQSGVLFEEGIGTRVTYHFWHPLLVDYLYDHISVARRVSLHKRAANVLRDLYHAREEEFAATITHHLLQGNAQALDIAHYAELAAHRAYALPAFEVAEQQYALAVEQLDRVAKATKRGTPGEQSHLIYLLERLAECIMIRGSYEEARHRYERLLELRTNAPAAAAFEEAQIQALLWVEIGWTWRYTGDSTAALEACERGEHVLRSASVIGGPAWARLLYLQSSVYWMNGLYPQAEQAALEALALFEQHQAYLATQPLAHHPIGHSPGEPTTRILRTLEGDPVDLGRVYRRLGDLAASQGRRSEALTHLNTALAIYEKYDNKREIAHVSCDLGYNYFKRAEYGLAQTALHRALNLAESSGDGPLISVIFSDLGELAASSGDLEEAEQWYTKALALLERTKDRVYLSPWNAALALVLQGQGKSEEATTCIIRALSIGRAMHNLPCIGTALVSLASIRIMQATKAAHLPARHARLLQHAHQDVQRALNLTGLDAETSTQAQLLLAQISLLAGKTKQAHTQLEAVIELAQSYELVLIEQQAHRLLKELVE